MRLLAIAVLSLLSMIPALSVTHGLLGLDDDVSGVIALVAAFLVTPSLLLYFWRSKPGFDALPVEPSDALMCEQIERAKAEIGRLLDGLDKGVLEAFVKFPLPVDGTIEHVWGMAHSHDGGAVVVSLASTPVAGLSDDMLGRRSVPLADIEDWMLRAANGKTYGGYTNLALARIYRREYGKLPRGMRREFEHFVDFSLD